MGAHATAIPKRKLATYGHQYAYTFRRRPLPPYSSEAQISSDWQHRGTGAARVHVHALFAQR
jgi:hypothetical protein